MAVKRPQKIRVLISGAGGAGTIAIIENLRAQGHYWIAAMDMDPYAAGLYLANKGIKVKSVKDPGYFERVRRIILKDKIDVYIPLIDEELLGAQALAKKIPGLKVITPREEFIVLVLNKYRMVQAFTQNGIACPRTFLARDVDRMSFASPKIVKPMTGRGSRGVAVIASWTDWNNYFKQHPYKPSEVIVQELIEGPEYTVSAVVGRSGHVYAVVPKKIIHKKGITQQSVTVNNDAIQKLAADIQNKFHADGPFNVQLILRADRPYVLEVNPRFSTTVAHTIAAGVDEVGCLIHDFCNGTGKKQRLDFKENLVMLRYLAQQYVPLNRLK